MSNLFTFAKTYFQIKTFFLNFLAFYSFLIYKINFPKTKKEIKKMIENERGTNSKLSPRKLNCPLWDICHVRNPWFAIIYRQLKKFLNFSYSYTMSLK